MYRPPPQYQFRATADAINWASAYGIRGPCVVWMRGWEHIIRLTPSSDGLKWDYGCYEPKGIGNGDFLGGHDD